MKEESRSAKVLTYCLVMSLWLIPSEQMMFTIIGCVTGGVSVILAGLNIRDNAKSKKYQAEKD